MITYQREDWDTFYRDCQEVWQAHYDELTPDKDRMPFRPAVDTYKMLEAAGRLQIVTARDDGRLVGHVATVICPAMHFADVLCGYEDVYFLAKSHRKGMTGVKLIREAIRHMQLVGVQRAYFMTKMAHNKGRIFEHLGFEHTDQVYSKWIGAEQ